MTGIGDSEVAEQFQEAGEAVGALFNFEDALSKILQYAVIAALLGGVIAFMTSGGWPLFLRAIFVIVLIACAMLAAVPGSIFKVLRMKRNDLVEATKVATKAMETATDRIDSNLSEADAGQLATAANQGITTALVASSPFYLKPIAAPAARRISNLIERNAQEVLATYLPATGEFGSVAQAAAGSSAWLDSADSRIEELTAQGLQRMTTPVLIACAVFGVPLVFLILLGLVL